MPPYEQQRSLLELPYKEPGVNYPPVVEGPRNIESSFQDVFDHLHCSNERLRGLAAELQARNTELEAYAHMVAHDLKDPLTVMIVTSDLITEIPDLPRQELKEYMQQIRSTAYEMKKIIDALLLFAEVDRAKVPMGPVDMARVLANVGDRLGHMIQEHQAQISFPAVWPEIIGYAPWIEEVWANYISNALKHGGRPPRLELGALDQPDGMLRFWIHDNGPGIPPDARPRLFTPFGQVERIHQTGHGLGLSIVLSIVEKLGGQVGVESELGKGSLFFFTLPADPSPPGRNLPPPLSNPAVEASCPS